MEAVRAGGPGGARGAGRGQEGTGAGGNGCMSAWRCRGAEGHRGHGGHGDLEGGSWAKMGACGGVLGRGGGGPIKGAKSRPQKGGQEQALTDKTLRRGGRMARKTQKKGHRRRLGGVNTLKTKTDKNKAVVEAVVVVVAEVVVVAVVDVVVVVVVVV